jgi:putative endonuclease
MRYFLYILRMSNGQLYVGTTFNIQQRLQDHRRHHAARTTKLLGAEQLLYTEEHPDRFAAEKRERQIKKWSHAKKAVLIAGNLTELKRLAKRKKS